MNRNRSIALVALLVVPALACTINVDTPTSPAPTVNTYVDSFNGPGHGGTPTPVPGSAGGASYVRVGIFAQGCPSGGQVPDNALNTIREGCTATFTATPKDAQGNDLVLPDSAWQAMPVTWMVQGTSCLDLDATFGNPVNKFNRQVKGATVGTCSVCASVNGMTGCAKQPSNGEQAVRVVS